MAMQKNMTAVTFLPSICLSAAQELTELASVKFREYVSEGIIVNKYAHQDKLPSKLATILTFIDHKGPAIYWLEVISECDGELLIKHLDDYRAKKKIYPNWRNIPALNGANCYSSKILYVGKVESNLNARMTQHLGFFKNKDTQGLQLIHWAAGLRLSVKFHVCPLPLAAKPYLALFEKKFAQTLQPLIGRHG
jgi:hypothetical protein